MSFVSALSPHGALVNLTMKSQVGVLLDEIPENEREQLVGTILNKSDNFWKQRAKEQVQLMNYRLVFREGYYPENESKGALPLPPKEIWNIQLQGQPIRTNVDNHDYIFTNYTFKATLLTDINSPGKSEPELKSFGGSWSEPFILPIDPTLLFQRTEFACMNENQFPPHSVDAEEVDTFFDYGVDTSGILSIEDAHQAVMPNLSCIESMIANIGKVSTSLIFERIPWNSQIANSVRIGEITNPTGPDLKVEKNEFETNRVVYRYITPDSCSIAEGSVLDGPGWHRLLQFGAADRNFGTKALDIGPIDYFIKGNETDLTKRGIYEYSLCHNHYHFTHYGYFSFGNVTTNHKMGFCLQSTSRASNNEYSSLLNLYPTCANQGIGPGWLDEYKIGLEGQWVDITKINTTKKPITNNLLFHSNPDEFLCEGKPVVDKNSNHIYEPTEFKTASGLTVYKPKCNFGKGTLENNIHYYNVTIPVDGQGYVTDDCKNGEIGPLRNCGFEKVKDIVCNCTPGQQVNLSFTIPNGAAPQIVRICDYSNALATAIPCTYNGPYNAKAIENIIVNPTAKISIIAPNALDKNEQGGQFSIYSGSLLPDDPRVKINYIMN